MMLTRRTALIAGSAALAAPALAQPRGDFRAAAAYSAQRRGVSMLVLRGGRVVFEDYPNEGAPERAWELASGTKSFVGAMAAAAVQDGLLSLDERCADTIPDWRADPRKAAITIRLLLSLCSGISGGNLGRPLGYEESLSEPAQWEPGSRFAYGPAPFQIFGAILQRKLRAAGRDPNPVVYLRERVLGPARIEIGRWRDGRDGNPLLPQGAALNARNWAAYGAWALRGGDGLVDRGALAANFAPSPANPGYGMTWWLLRPGLIGPTEAMPIEAPDDLAARYDVRMAAGAGDQRLYLIPPLDMVIVRQASGILRAMLRRARDYSDAAFLRLALGA